MNPDKLFDYLEGRLSPADRTALEEKLMADSQLRQQFQVAREIHRTGKDAREVVLMPEDPATLERGARMGRRVATVAIVLVFLNVLGGLGVIAWKRRNTAAENAHEVAVRRQLEQSLGAAGQNALPPPTLSDDELNLAASKAEWEKLAVAVVAAAESSGGSAIRDDREDEIIVTASIPRARMADFRKLVLGTPAPRRTEASSEAPSATATVQVRIAETAR